MLRVNARQSDQTKSASKSAGGSASSAGESLSQLIAKILDQMSTTAWLPSAVLVSLTLLVATIWQNDGDVSAALTEVTQMEFTQLLLLVGAVIVTTTVTQAFEFGAIQTLEGYWGTGWLGRRLANRGVRRFTSKKQNLESRLREAREQLVGQMRTRLKNLNDVTEKDRLIIENDILELPEEGSEQELRSAREVDWRARADSSVVRLAEELENALQFYPPKDYRILPTRVGNTMRSYEDRIVANGHAEGLGGAEGGRTDADDGRLQGYVERLVDRLPEELRRDHDLHRQRLDLYASLVFVFAAAGLLAFPVLAVQPSRAGLVVPAACWVLAWLSYRALNAAARGYGGMLETIQIWERRAVLPADGGASRE